ncbi:MAG: metalloregulator ArsR/SmtB family transcription factor [Desulfotignum sp.]|nr:metalloregulator ArsR/SmtB family transcription factor [Desulfotignum sp.]
MDDTLLKLKALADRNRLRIFLALTRYDELCACQITELLQVTGATASRHLGILVTAGLLKSRKASRWVYFSLEDRCMDMDGILGWLLPRVQTSEPDADGSCGSGTDHGGGQRRSLPDAAGRGLLPGQKQGESTWVTKN